MGWKLSRVVNQRIDYRPNTADFASKNSNLGKYRNILGQRLEDVPFINEAYLKMLYRNKNE